MRDVVVRGFALRRRAETPDELQRVDVPFVDAADAQIDVPRATQRREFAPAAG